MRAFDVDFLPKGTRFRPTFWLRVHVLGAFWCPSWLVPWPLASWPPGPLALWPPGPLPPGPWPLAPWLATNFAVCHMLLFKIRTFAELELVASGPWPLSPNPWPLALGPVRNRGLETLQSVVHFARRLS